MAVGPLGRLVELLAWPVAGAVELVHGRLTGSCAILEVDVEEATSVLQAQVRLEQLRQVCDDPRVVGLWLRLRAAPGGWATTSDLREVVLALRAAGKQVWASVEAPGNALMWLASACSRVFITPGGEVAAVGVGLEITLLGETLERLGLEVEVGAAGAYKSAGEMFTRSHATPEHLQVMRNLAEQLNDQLVQGIASGRRLAAEQVRADLGRMPMGPHEAVQAGWVDQVAYEDEVRAAFERAAGVDVRWQAYAGWAGRQRILRWVRSWGRGAGHVAVLHLEGAVVVDDKSSGPAIRARAVCEVLQELAEDDRVRAVVLHVVSPGGSALASDLLWREVVRLQERKPVVASFGDVAASGGFYLAAGANEIVARASTLTGSIGVVGGKVVAREAMRRLGVVIQTVDAAPNATMLSPGTTFSREQRERFISSLTRVYDAFVERVAAGRGQSIDVVEPHCRGRVWLGNEALEVGLVDRLGDLHDAVARAAELAGLELGPGARVDLEARPVPLWQVLFRTAYAQRIPGAWSAVDELLGPTVGPMVDLLRLWRGHAGQAMALLPLVIERDGR